MMTNHMFTHLFIAASILSLFCSSLFAVHDEDYMMEDATKTVYKGGVCGNGIKDPGEDCDCGSIEQCKTDPCCHPTCQFKLDSQCSNDEPCCRNCKLQRKGETCYTPNNDCRVYEYCSGEKGDCPRHAHKKNSAACFVAEYGDGICIAGVCRAFAAPCTKDTKSFSGSCPVEHVCVNQTCYRASAFTDFITCPSNDASLECSGNGDCSHGGTCQCHPEWGGSDCSTKRNKIQEQSNPNNDRPGKYRGIGPEQRDSTSNTIALASGLVGFVLTVSIIFIIMACRFLPTRTPKDESSMFPPAHIDSLDADGPIPS